MSEMLCIKVLGCPVPIGERIQDGAISSRPANLEGKKDSSPGGPFPACQPRFWMIHSNRAKMSNPGQRHSHSD